LGKGKNIYLLDVIHWCQNLTKIQEKINGYNHRMGDKKKERPKDVQLIGTKKNDN